MNLRRGWIWYLAGLLLAATAGVMAMLALRQAVPRAQPTRAETRPVIVASRDLAARQIVTQDALDTRELPVEQIPSGAIFRIEDAVGKFSFQDVKAGQPLLAQNLVAPSTGPGAIITSSAQLALLLPPDKVGVVLPADDLLSQSGDVSIGDHMDILASLAVAGKDAAGKDLAGGQVTLMNLQNVPVVKVLQEAPPSGGLGGQAAQQPPKITGLVLAVDPQDGIILKYFIDSGAKVSLDLRSPRLTVTFDVSPVTLEYLANKYNIRVPQPLENR
jgi:Flp pilus assembly protein CpaB